MSDVATFAGRPFRLEPESIAWDFSVKTSARKTIGGKVIQVYGANIGDMTVTGSFGVGGWEEQAEFFERMIEVAESSANGGPPVRFTWGDRGWDFAVYLKAHSSPQGKAIEYGNEIINPQWTLTLFIVEENINLKTMAENFYIDRIAKGLGWTPGPYNGPLTYADVQSYLTSVPATTINDAFSHAYAKSPGTTPQPDPVEVM